MTPFITIGSLQIPVFFLVISIGLSGLLIYLSKRVEVFNKDRKAAFDIALILMISGFIGGRAMHVLYEEPNYYIANPEYMFFFWRGGFTFYGGLILCFLSSFIYMKARRLEFPSWADFFTPLLSLAHSIGRVGCFMSGCCFGRNCELPWAFNGRHPTALYLSIGEFLIFLLIFFFEKLVTTRRQGLLFTIWILLHSTLRLVVEFYRDDFRGAFFYLAGIGSLSVSQLISIVLIATSIFSIFYLLRKKQLA